MNLKEYYKEILNTLLSEQYLDEASNARRIRRLGNRVEKGGSLQPGQAEAILRQASTDPNLGGNNSEERTIGNMNRQYHNYAPPRIATKDAMGNMMRRSGGLVKIYRGMPDAERGAGAESLLKRFGMDGMNQMVRPGGPSEAQRRAVKTLKKQNQALRIGKIVKEDIETPLRNAENNKAIKKLEDTYKSRIEKAAAIPNPHVRSTASDNALERANQTLTKLSKRIALQKKEQASRFRIGIGGKRRKTT